MNTKITEPTRELSRRRAGTIEVVLLWYPITNEVEVRVHDSASTERFEFRVPPGDAMDAFRHPYAYAYRRETHHLLLASAHVPLEGPDPHSIGRNP